MNLKVEPSILVLAAQRVLPLSHAGSQMVLLFFIKGIYRTLDQTTLDHHTRHI